MRVLGCRAIALVVFLSFLLSPCWAELLSDPVTFRKETGKGYERIHFTNSSSVPVSIKLNLDLKNVSVGGPQDLLVLPPNKSVQGPTFRVTNPNMAWNYRFDYMYNFGDYRVSAPTDAFDLPWAEGVAFKTGQSFHGTLSHHGNEGYAVDFPMSVGTPIHAARRGLVVRVEEKFTEGGWRSELRDKGNQVTIAHTDGTLSRYLHLKTDGALVELGQWVESGDLIGLSGNVGYTNGPHLHFDVSRPGRDLVTQTIPFKLRVNGSSIIPVEGETYLR